MSNKKWLIATFSQDNSIVPLEVKRLFVAGKLQFLTEDGKKLKVRFGDEWYEGEVIDQAGM